MSARVTSKSRICHCYYRSTAQPVLPKQTAGSVPSTGFRMTTSYSRKTCKTQAASVSADVSYPSCAICGLRRSRASALTLMEARFEAWKELTPLQSEKSGGQNDTTGWSEEGQ